MLGMMKRPTRLASGEDTRPCEQQEATNSTPASVILDQADGILRRSAAISPTDEVILFKALELCAAVGERRGEQDLEGVRSLEDIEALQRKVVAHLVERNIPLVHKMRRRCPMAGIDPDDLLSEGCWSLYRAVNGFDVWRGLRFSTYACRSILYSFLSLAKKRRREREILEKLLKERPTVTHAGDLEVDVDGPRLLDEVNAALFDKSAGFTDIECCVIEQRFLASSRNRPPTLESIGRVYQLSKERVRQIQCGALAKLRTILTHRSALGGHVEFAFADRN